MKNKKVNETFEFKQKDKVHKLKVIELSEDKANFCGDCFFKNFPECEVGEICGVSCSKKFRPDETDVFFKELDMVSDFRHENKKFDTLPEYNKIVGECASLFSKKQKDYGTAWRIMRTTSLTDQIFIKAQRIRSIQDKGTQIINDAIKDEFIGIINYSVMALIQLTLGVNSPTELTTTTEKALDLYRTKIEQARTLMLKKNHDYGEAWRNMRVSSITDIILMKLLRVKQIEDNNGKTFVSEGLEANYLDILNYAVFALIQQKNF